MPGEKQIFNNRGGGSRSGSAPPPTSVGVPTQINSSGHPVRWDLRPPGSDGTSTALNPDTQWIPNSPGEHVLTQEDFFSQLLAQQQAEAAARQARVAQATAVINSIFSGRGGMFDQYADQVYGLSADRLGEEQQDASRDLKFALARSGLTGGSVDVDKRADLESTGQRGLLEARSFADRQAAQLAAAEEQARQSLLGIASSGNVTGGQIGGLAQGLQGSTNQLLSAPTAQPGLGQIFAGLADNIGQALFARGIQSGFGVGIPGQADQFSSFVQPGSRREERGTITPSG